MKFMSRLAAVIFGITLSLSAWAGLESVTHISDLNASWPLGSDLASTSDDHIRNIKTALKTDFPNVNGAVSLTPTQFNQLISTQITWGGTSTEHILQNSLAGANSGRWDILALSGRLDIRSIDDANGTAKNILDVTRSTTTLSNISLGNAADNPSYTFLGTGALSFGGAGTFTGVLTANNQLTVNNLLQVSRGNTANVASFDGTNAGGSWITVESSGVSELYLGTGGSSLGPGAVTDGVLRAENNLFINHGSTNVMKVTTGNAIQGLGPVAAALVDMTPDTGTFTATYTGFTATITCTASWYRIGKAVTLQFCAATGTSNATTMTMTGLPSAIQAPSTTQRVPLANSALDDNSLQISVPTNALVTAASGTVTFIVGNSSAGFTNSGVKGFAAAATISYLLN